MFPLLRLPLLALEQVIKQVEIKELFPLSLCSKRTNFIVKHFRDKSIILEFDLHGQVGVRLDISDLSNMILAAEFRITRLQQMPLDRPTWSTVGEILKIQKTYEGFVVYCENVQKGTRVLVNYICDLFEKKIDRVLFINRTSWMMKLIEHLQGLDYEAVILCDFSLEDEEEGDFRNLIISCKANNLQIHHCPSKKFRFENFPKKYDRLVIQNGHWVTVDNLLTLDCEQIHIDNTFSSEDITRFLKHWIQGGTRKLKAFSAHVRNVEDENEIYTDIEVLMISGSQEFRFKEVHWKFDGKYIRRVDGMLASVQYCQMEKFFRLAVWEDFQGNRIQGFQ